MAITQEEYAEKLTAQQEAGKVAVQIFSEAELFIKEGVNLLDIDKRVSEIIAENKMTPSFKGFHGYPAATCLSVNYEVVHGIPSDYKLKSGDVLKLDLGITNRGWIVDTARTYLIGNVDETTQNLLVATQTALNEAIKLCRKGNKTGDIGAKISEIITRGGFYVIPELQGHGVGKKLQESPSIPNFGTRGTGASLVPGMSLAIEPITATESTQVFMEEDGWTISCEKNINAVQVEDTIMVTDGDPIILTR